MQCAPQACVCCHNGTIMTNTWTSTPMTSTSTKSFDTFLSLQFPMQSPRIWMNVDPLENKNFKTDSLWFQIPNPQWSKFNQIQLLPEVGFRWFRCQAACWSSGRLFIIRAIIITDVRTLTAMGGHGWGMVMASNGGTPCAAKNIQKQLLLWVKNKVLA